MDKYAKQAKYFNQVKLFDEKYQINFFKEMKQLFYLLSKIVM